MDEGDIIIQLEELAKKFSVQIRYEAIKQEIGRASCRERVYENV
jgi:hypothetical protein